MDAEQAVALAVSVLGLCVVGWGFVKFIVIGMMREEMEEINEKLTTILRNQGDHEGRFNSGTTRMDNHERRLDSLEDGVSGFNDRLAGLINRFNRLDGKVDGLSK